MNTYELIGAVLTGSFACFILVAVTAMFFRGVWGDRPGAGFWLATVLFPVGLPVVLFFRLLVVMRRYNRRVYVLTDGEKRTCDPAQYRWVSTTDSLKTARRIVDEREEDLFNEVEKIFSSAP